MTIGVVSMIRDPWGGSEELWYQMALEAVAAGHKIVHLRYEAASVHPKIAELQALGVVCLTRPGYVKARRSPVGVTLHLALNFVRKKIQDPFAALFRYRPDVVLYNGTCYSIATEKELLPKLQSTNSPFFLLGHLNHDLQRTISDADAVVTRTAYQKAEKVLFVSYKNLQAAQRQLCFNITNAQVIRNPVNLTVTERLSFPEVTIPIAFALVGNLATVHKGQDIVLQILSSPEWKSRNWTLSIYGTGYDAAYLVQLVAFLELTDRVLFHGKVSDIRKVWADNHVLLMPSHMEGMPLAVVEAMLCGRVCIVTDAGGSTEWITNNESGYVAPAASLSAYGAAMETAWQSRDCWEEMGAAAYRAALANYDPAAGKTLLNLLTDV